MNVGAWLVWGFVGTVVLTSLMMGSQGAGITRMNIPYMLGTMFTANRDRAKVIGAVTHFMMGWLFSLVYVMAFQQLGRATWWFGALTGVVQAGFVLTAGMALLPSLHPRMATELQGPTVVTQLEPPGFLALNYGYRTPLSVVIAHMVFGGLLGAFYPL